MGGGLVERRTRGNYRKPLQRNVSKDVKDPLFIVHVTTVGYGREIIDQDIIEARYCRHFGKKLTYFFVDRPGYRMRESDEKSDQINRFPLVFVLPLAAFPAPYHVYPFDTGAALNKLFDEKADPHIFLDDYELGSSIAGINGYIRWAFGSRQDYFTGRLRADLEETFTPWDSTEKSVIDIARLASPAHNRPDKRASAIEIAYSANFSISRRDARVILPKQLLEWGKNSNTQMVEQLTSMSLDWFCYDWTPNARPADFFEDISQIIATEILGLPQTDGV